MAGRSVHFFLGKLERVVNQYFVHILSLVNDEMVTSPNRTFLEAVNQNFEHIFLLATDSVMYREFS